MTRAAIRPCIWQTLQRRAGIHIGRQEGKRVFVIGRGTRRQSSTSNGGGGSTNPAMTFPCLDKLEHKSRTLETGPEPSYSRVSTGYKIFKSREDLYLDYGGVLSEFDIAYETWGTMNKDKSNVILVHTGLSASSHAKSHPGNPTPGWWEKFIGPGAPLDTDRFFIICTNVIGSCYGSTGPSSIDPSDGRRYATRFPVISVDDMIRAQARLIRDEFGIGKDEEGSPKLYASVGSSMGGMQSLSMAVHHPNHVGRVVSISGCGLSHPYSIALRHTQRQVLMADRNWRRGFYYDDGVPPYIGMKLAREIATVTYRSGPEWEERFGRVRADPSKPPALCPDFLIETYLDHQGEKFCTEYDANSLLYVSKAMDLFDLSKSTQERLSEARRINKDMRKAGTSSTNAAQGSCPIPDEAYEEQPGSVRNTETAEERDADLVAGLSPMANIPTFVLGVQSDFLFPSWQQKQVADCLVRAGNNKVTHVELGLDVSLYGHDTFLLSLEHVGAPLKEFLEKSL